MRIAIVNDTMIAVELLRRVVLSLAGCEVAWTAGDGEEAVRKCAMDVPDILIMDLLMPKMNGVEATRRIMRDSPCAILIVTASTDDHPGLVFTALGEGALDAINIPPMSIMTEGDSNRRELVRKLNTLRKLVANGAHAPAPREHKKIAPPTGTVPFLVAIGGSTGGPKAIADVLAVLPGDLPAAIAVVQHIDRQFVHGLADWLAGYCRLPIRIAAPGDAPVGGEVLLAGTNDHLVMRPDLRFDYRAEPKENPFRPSADVFFGSLADHWPKPGVGILLTGIGRDGAAGLLRLRRAGWHTLAQDRDSCVVYGMPKTAVELHAAEEVLPPSAIGEKIKRFVWRADHE
ncbi:MAG: chemotaxis-specific protein-glutamate methyltransferase CheB [Victivallales bacterium]|nr:chemotaxis-specific protein-glutamate methyltransferase CheB [Victivallales bacterium]